MRETLLDALFILNRYLHIVCTTVIVGGTLFFELIVPVATDDLKQEQQLSVFGRARWGFRTVVWACAILLVVSGIVSSLQRWQDYRDPELASVAAGNTTDPPRSVVSDIRRPGWWWAAHVSTGMIALLVAVTLMTVRRPPTYPLGWMRLSLTILLVVIFFGTTARHMRLSAYEHHLESTAE